MILTGNEILTQVAKNNITIEPFVRRQVNPNSYNLRIAPELFVYENYCLDAKKPQHLVEVPFKDGATLEPNHVYLARTVEHTFTDKFVPMLEGRSSLGRLGLFVHVTAGFGDLGFSGYWTLELHCVQPVTIYPYMEICQIYFHTYKGVPSYYSQFAKYNHNTGVQASQIWREFDIDGTYRPERISRQDQECGEDCQPQHPRKCANPLLH